jgi:hypothetical protein
MNQDKQKRIFWLGMHVVLVKTELPRLRELGYEVFNPPYLTDVYDQSAVVDWDRNQASTLPPEVFQKLSRYNFFYNSISPEMAELLDEYFGTVVVTISPGWLQSVLDSYHGRVIYRVYGQPGTLSEAIWNMKLFRSIQERENFYFVPHAAEAIRDEHAWLKTRMSVVPYTLPLDVFKHENTWCPQDPHSQEIMVCCPNIDNPHFAHHYQYLNSHFPEPHFKLYGVQPRKMPDPRVAGTLPREEQLNRYRQASGYFYHYQIPSSSYLPPIEMMTIGGPVVYMRDSLLARSFAGEVPGEASGVADAKRKIQWLLEGDRQYIDEVRAAQQQIVRRYHPDHVNPIFDRVFTQLIDRPDVPRQEVATIKVNSPAASRPRSYVLFHAPGEHVLFQDGAYLPADELARSVKRVVQELLAQTENEVVVTCFADQFQHAYGYLDGTQFLGRLRFMVLDPAQLGNGSAGTKWESKLVAPAAASSLAAANVPTGSAPTAPTSPAMIAAPQQPKPTLKSRIRSLRERVSDTFYASLVKTLGAAGKNRVSLTILLITAGLALGPIHILQKMRGRLRGLKQAVRSRLGRWRRSIQLAGPWAMRRDCVTHVNADTKSRIVVVPHRSLFPEALLLERPIVLYFDDAPSTPVGGLRQKLHNFIGRCMSVKAIAVISCEDLAPLSQATAQVESSSATSSPPSSPSGGAGPAMAPHAWTGGKTRREEALVVSQSSADDKRTVNRTPPQGS